MKHDVNEAIAVEGAVREIEGAVTELNDLELVLVGGGTGEVVIA